MKFPSAVNKILIELKLQNKRDKYFSDVEYIIRCVFGVPKGCNIYNIEQSFDDCDLIYNVYTTVEMFANGTLSEINHFLLKEILEPTFKLIPNFTVTIPSGKTYSLTYTAPSEALPMRIVASCGSQEISCNVVPLVHLEGDYYIPHWRSSTDFVKYSSLSDELAVIESKGNNALDALTLMSRLINVHKSNMPGLTNSMIKSVVLEACLENTINWQTDLDVLLIEMWKKLVRHLEAGIIPLYLNHETNMLDQLSRLNLIECRNTAINLSKKLQYTYYAENSVFSLFGLYNTNICT